MAELADALDLGSSGVIRVGSTPTTRTNKNGLESLFSRPFIFVYRTFDRTLQKAAVQVRYFLPALLRPWVSI